MTNSPWLSMWLAPRVTVRHLIASDPAPSWIPVVGLAGVHRAILWASAHPGYAASSGAVTAAAVAIFFGVVELVYGVLIGPFLLAIVGGWFGGEGDPTDIRQAVAWGLVPIAVTTGIWIPLLAVYGPAAFDPNRPAPQTFLQVIVLLLLLLIPIANMWSFVLQVAGIAEAQRLSIWKALISVIILLIPALLLTGALR